jgi:hypothetical protein
MAENTEHNKIEELAGIPSAISEEINLFMDDTNPPKDFEDHNTENKIFVCGHLNVSIRTMMGSEKLQGRGKKEWVQKEDLKWLLSGIYQEDSKLRDILIFKGGTAIRKIFFPEWRLSEDMDFTIMQEIDPSELKQGFEQVFSSVNKKSSMSGGL